MMEKKARKRVKKMLCTGANKPPPAKQEDFPTKQENALDIIIEEQSEQEKAVKMRRDGAKLSFAIVAGSILLLLLVAIITVFLLRWPEPHKLSEIPDIDSLTPEKVELLNKIAEIYKDYDQQNIDNMMVFLREIAQTIVYPGLFVIVGYIFSKPKRKKIK